jgi:hypothetical protein
VAVAHGDYEMSLFRPVARALISRYSIAIIGLIVVVPLVLAIKEISHVLWVNPDLKEPMEIINGIGVILIGLGVVLEERKALRDICGLSGGPDEAMQEYIDKSCHHYGVGQLVLGLLAEICIESIKIPNSILYTGEVDDYLVAGGCFFVGVAALLLVRHAVVLIFLKPQPH